MRLSKRIPASHLKVPTGLAMMALALVLGATLYSAETPGLKPPEIIAGNAEKIVRFQVVSREISADQTQAKYVLKSEMGIFRCRINLTNTPVTNLVVVVAGEQYCEGLDFQSDGGQRLELKHLAGVQVKVQEKEGVVIHFSQEALEKMKPGGILQFINQYR